MSPYELLGVEPGATELDVRRAHRDLVRLLQPDARAGEPGTRTDRHLRVVDEARDRVLADVRRRERHVAPAPVDPDVARPVVPLQRSSTTDLSAVPSTDAPSSEREAGQRWAEHQDWLRNQQHGRDSLTEREDRVAERRRQQRRALFLAPFLLVLTGDVALALGKLLGTGLLS